MSQGFQIVRWAASIEPDGKRFRIIDTETGEAVAYLAAEGAEHLQLALLISMTPVLLKFVIDSQVIFSVMAREQTGEVQAVAAGMAKALGDAIEAAGYRWTKKG